MMDALCRLVEWAAYVWLVAGGTLFVGVCMAAAADALGLFRGGRR